MPTDNKIHVFLDIDNTLTLTAYDQQLGVMFTGGFLDRWKAFLRLIQKHFGKENVVFHIITFKGVGPKGHELERDGVDRMSKHPGHFYDDVTLAVLGFLEEHDGLRDFVNDENVHFTNGGDKAEKIKKLSAKSNFKLCNTHILDDKGYDVITPVRKLGGNGYLVPKAMYSTEASGVELEQETIKYLLNVLEQMRVSYATDDADYLTLMKTHDDFIVARGKQKSPPLKEQDRQPSSIKTLSSTPSGSSDKNKHPERYLDNIGGYSSYRSYNRYSCFSCFATTPIQHQGSYYRDPTAELRHNQWNNSIV